LYKTYEDAEVGVSPEGTGVLVFWPSLVNPDRGFTIGVSNWHVAVKKGGSIARIRKLDGTFEIVEKDPAEWLFDPMGDDLAVTGMSGLTPEAHDYKTIQLDLFATEEWCKVKQIGVGDDGFMLGLLLHSGKHDTGIPTARFGHISMMPGTATEIAQDNGCKRPSFVLDMHSRGGFSGSPVFVYRTPGSTLDGANTNRIMFGEGSLFSFLGLHWGQFPEEWKITESSGPGTHVTGLSGLTCVIPAWRIRHFIENQPAIAASYAEMNARLAADPAANTARPD
jgi:hypothetical protein